MFPVEKFGQGQKNGATEAAPFRFQDVDDLS
jgi:hypothetical protein